MRISKKFNSSKNNESNCKSIIKSAILYSVSLTIPFVNAGEVANVQHLVTSIYFSPNLHYGQLALTVSGAGVNYEKELNYGETISFSAEDVGLSSLPDGSYSYNLIALPEFDQKAWEDSIDDEAAENAFLAQEKANTYSQSGMFKVYLGQIKQQKLENDS